MLQQMLEDKDDVVRESVIKALALLSSFCDYSDKYGPGEQLAIKSLNDSSNGVINLTSQILFPVLGKWAMEKGNTLTYSKYLIIFFI